MKLRPSLAPSPRSGARRERRAAAQGDRVRPGAAQRRPDRDERALVALARGAPNGARGGGAGGGGPGGGGDAARAGVRASVQGARGSLTLSRRATRTRGRARARQAALVHRSRGLERGGDAKAADKQTRKEDADINTSLPALKEVIRSLDRKSGHMPFRGSKLTQVLKSSLVGDGAEAHVMVACVAPGCAAASRRSTR